MIFPGQLKIDKTWSLFLDRDGVINKRFMDAYVLKPEDFHWLEGAKESIARLSSLFGNIVVVTNQQGIGKGLMTEKDLDQIHTQMLKDVQNAGGRIDKVYYCKALKEENSWYRKPKPGMALLARKDFPAIRFKKSVMVGDTLSDMIFGKNLNMLTVAIGMPGDVIAVNHRLIDLAFDSLHSMTEYFFDQNTEAS